VPHCDTALCALVDVDVVHTHCHLRHDAETAGIIEELDIDLIVDHAKKPVDIGDDLEQLGARNRAFSSPNIDQELLVQRSENVGRKVVGDISTPHANEAKRFWVSYRYHWGMRRGAILILFALAMTACGAGSEAIGGGGSTSEDGPGAGTTTPSQETADSAPNVPVAEPEETTHSRPIYAGFEASLGTSSSLVATTRGETVIYDAPGSNREVTTLPAETILGTVTVLAVVQEDDNGWLEVRLPIRPNGTTGWVHESKVELFVVEGRIVVDLSDRELTYTVNGRETLTATVAIGKSAYPTPVGQFFVTDMVQLSKAGTPWGPFALGLSGRSDTITEFNGGDGIIGIHGTNSPDSIGKAASLGCVRLPNDLITELYGLVTLGTPVEIRA
jgi:lipoprotein-anchoring transpeptidase ErfK/SrfK